MKIELNGGHSEEFGEKEMRVYFSFLTDGYVGIYPPLPLAREFEVSIFVTVRVFFFETTKIGAEAWEIKVVRSLLFNISHTLLHIFVSENLYLLIVCQRGTSKWCFGEPGILGA